MKLSIIIPAYNAEPYIDILIERLSHQIRDDIEVCVIDDGSKKPYIAPYKWINLIRQENKGLSNARNTGIEATTGEYIQFIDADDLVPENYVEYILNLIDKEKPDYIELSWKSFDEAGGTKFDYKLRPNESLTNPSACTRVFKRSFLGNLRFNENKDTAEDEDLFRRLDFSKGKKAVATEYMYFYRTSTPNSLSKRYRKGLTKTKRVIYYYDHITKDMKWLINEIKEEREKDEIIIMTKQNDVPELAKYALILSPMNTYAHEVRGERTRLITLMEKIETQVVLYLANPSPFGGRETFMVNFCAQMSKHYDIIAVFEELKPELQARLIPYVQVMKNTKDVSIVCDTIILNSVFDKIPENIGYRQSIQMVHGCKASTAGMIPTDRDITVCVSQTVKDSFGLDDAIVIKNMTSGKKPKKIEDDSDILKLITASRLSTDPRFEDKGAGRMIQLAKMLEEKGIDYEWGYFAESPILNAPRGLIFHEAVNNVKDYIAEADYLVQLSSAEAFCYSVVEALEIGTPVIVTPLPVFEELKIRDGKEGYIVPFDMNFNVSKLLEIPKVKYKYNNGTLVSKWKQLLGDSKPKGEYKPEAMLLVRITTAYRDMQIGRVMKINEKVFMPEERAKAVQEVGYGVIVEV